jgi:hypothetical protein
MPPLATVPKRRRWPYDILAAGCGALLTAVAVVIVLYAIRDTTPSRAASSPSTAAATSSVPTEVRVGVLMARMVCQGDVIETQLHSKETGRCKLDGVTVTIATFASDALRDKWVAYGDEFGGNLVAGDGWAAAVDTPDGAEKVANLLDGQRV